MDKCDIFFDTNTIKLRGEWFETCYITAGLDVEAGDLVYEYGMPQYKSLFGVALEPAKFKQRVHVLYKADRILLPYYLSGWKDDMLGEIFPIGSFANQTTAVALSWTNQPFGHAAPLEQLSVSLYFNDDGSLRQASLGLFELFGVPRPRVTSGQEDIPYGILDNQT